VFGLVKSGGLLSGVKLCRCHETMMARLGVDVGVIIHWVGEHCLFDVVWLVEGCDFSYLLYREVYGFK